MNFSVKAYLGYRIVAAFLLGIIALLGVVLSINLLFTPESRMSGVMALLGSSLVALLAFGGAAYWTQELNEPHHQTDTSQEGGYYY